MPWLFNTKKEKKKVILIKQESGGTLDFCIEYCLINVLLALYALLARQEPFNASQCRES